MESKQLKIIVNGKPTDQQTRCVHYHSSLDIVAIKFSCCEAYYCCYYCHEEGADHPARVWPQTAFDQKAVLCGVCKNEMSIAQYKTANYSCPFCNAPFNPKCANHDHLYFEV